MGIINACKIQNFEEEEFKTISSLRQKSHSKYLSINKSDNFEKQLKDYKDAIEIDNTNEFIIHQYILFLKDSNSRQLKFEMKKYCLFFENIKNGKNEIFKFFQKVINYNQQPIDKINFFQYLLEETTFINEIVNYNNNLPILKNSGNIFFCILYSYLLNNIINKYKKEIKSTNIKALIQKNKKLIEFTKNSLKEKKIEANYYKITLEEIDNILSCKFFNIFINLLSKFMKKINFFIDYLNGKSKQILKINKNMLLEQFIFYICKREFKETDNPILNNEYYCFNDSVIDIKKQIELYNNDDIKITNSNNNKVYIQYNNYPQVEFNNEIYSIGYACNSIKNQKGSFTNYEKLKFSYFDSNNIFRKNFENIKKDIKDIFSSNCMRNLIEEEKLFDLFNYNNQELLDEILNNIYFYPFFAEDSYASFIENFHTIYIQGIAKDELDSIEYIIVLYAFILVCLIHEIFHFYFSYMRFISKDKKRFHSPLPNNGSLYALERKGESGEWIEELFFGRHIQDLSTKEALFILGMKNYKGGFYFFRKDFENCNKKDNNNFGIDNIKKYIENLENFESFKLENRKIDNKIFKFSKYSNKKTSEFSVGEDIFFDRFPSYFNNKLDNKEINDILAKYAEKFKNITKNN